MGDEDMKNSVNDGKDLELEVSKFFNSSRAALAKISMLMVEDCFFTKAGLSSVSGSAITMRSSSTDEDVFMGVSDGGDDDGGEVAEEDGLADSGWSFLERFLLRLELGLVWIREWRVNSSDRLNFLKHPGNEQEWGFSPVWVRMCLV